MKSRTKRLTQALVLNLPLMFLRLAHGQDSSKPIVDVRFDEPYQQIESSVGDEWAPTWGRDDVLYTGNDDGSSFGGIKENNFAFGKLEGGAPNHLQGISINAMDDFREPVLLGPEGAQWNTLATYQVNGARYRFVACGSESSQSNDTCLAVSHDDGKTWGPVGGTPLFHGEKFRSPSFIAFSKGTETDFGGKPGEYIYAAAYSGVNAGADQYFVARVPAAKLQRANGSDWSFRQADDSFAANLDSAAPMTNSSPLGPDGANWKTMNTYSVDGVLYMFVTRCHYPSQSSDPKGRHIFENSSIIKSTDNGRTWTRPGPENYAKPMFPGKRFGTPYLVWYGKDGAASVDNADRYVYAVSNNGHFENGDDYVLGRVLRSKLADLSPADWSFYKAGDGMQDASWTQKLNEAKPILTHPGKSSMTGMTYIDALHRYVMVVWHYHRDNFEQGIKAQDLGTVLEFFESPKPWGPWTRVKAFDTGRLGWYTPIVGQRFQTSLDSSTVKAYFYATGFLTKPEGGLDMALYKLNYIPITLSTKPLPNNNPNFVGGR